MPRRRTITTPVPACPRCGYDQSGAIATWNASCPTGSTCSECGLEFAWRDVLSPSHGRLPWLYEHGRGLAPGRLVRSMLMTLVPSRFWAHVRMSHRISPGRLLLLVLMPVCVLHLLAGVNRLAAEAWWYREFWSAGRLTRPVPPGTPMTTAAPAWRDVWASVSDGGDWGVVATKLAVSFGSMHPGGGPLDALGGALARPSIWLVVLHLWWAFMLLALPDTRAIAKVRPAHVARAVAYPVALCLVLLYLGATVTHWVDAWDMLGGRSWRYRPDWLEPALVLVGMAWAAWWWLGVCRRYLRLPRPILVWLVTGGVAMLGTLSFLVGTAVFVLSHLRYG